MENKEMKPENFDLEKELAHSKINININEIDKTKQFLVTREWDCFDDEKIIEIENKTESIFKQLNLRSVKNLMDQINSATFENYFKDYIITDNKYKIGCVSSLNFLIESTYFFRNNNEESLQFDFKELNPYLHKYRNIKGDGECFYRGLIFSLLENIILTNNIMQMKELLILYYEKINKNNKLIKEKDFLTIINKMNISIVSEIMYILIKLMENDVSKAYEVLLKVFLFCKDFDFGLIFFTRYLIYEYIAQNEDKIYSKQYQVEVGCLLPDDYVVDRGDKNEYFFENFYSLQLMVPKTFAEKIVLYVVPYVFNINMNILIYDYGIGGEISNIHEKVFLNENNINSKTQINLLFRKSHYDVYYKKDFYEKYKQQLNIFINRKENEIKSEKEKIKMRTEAYEKKKEKENINLLRENQGEKNDKKNEKEDDINKYFNSQPSNNKNDNNSPICLECQKTYTNKENAFALCDDCLLYNLKSLLLSTFLEFLRKKDNLFNSKKKFKELLSINRCKISIQENLSISEAIYNSKFKFDELFLSVRSQICLFCGQQLNDENDYYIKLACKCKICSKKCFNGYFKYIQNIIQLKEDPQEIYVKYINLLTCFCGFIYNTKDVLYMMDEMDIKDMKEEKKIYEDYIFNVWNWRCCICTNNFKSKQHFGKGIFKSPPIFDKLLNSNKEFKHLLCDNCYEKNNISNINKQKTIVCNVCEFEHEIINYIKVNEKNEEEKSCLIF